MIINLMGCQLFTLNDKRVEGFSARNYWELRCLIGGQVTPKTANPHKKIITNYRQTGNCVIPWEIPAVVYLRSVLISQPHVNPINALLCLIQSPLSEPNSKPIRTMQEASDTQSLTDLPAKPYHPNKLENLHIPKSIRYQSPKWKSHAPIKSFAP